MLTVGVLEISDGSFIAKEENETMENLNNDEIGNTYRAKVKIDPERENEIETNRSVVLFHNLNFLIIIIKSHTK